MKIITNWAGLAEQYWCENVNYEIHVIRDFVGRTSKSKVLSILKDAIWLAKNEDKYSVGIFSGVYFVLLFSICRKVIRRKKKNIPIVMFECLWYKEKNIIKRLFQLAKFMMLDNNVDQYIVWAEREIEDYSKKLNITKSKIKYVPFFYTTNEYSFNVKEENYIFSGGNFDRDYKTLIKAVEGLPYSVIIASNLERNFKGITIPPNVKIVSVGHNEFRELMASCKINIVMMGGGYLHSGGQQTMLNGMYMGKPTIITDYAGAKCYFENFVDAIAIEPGDGMVLREQIVKLYEDKEYYEIIKKNGISKAMQYSPKNTCSQIIRLSFDLVSKK